MDDLLAAYERTSFFADTPGGRLCIRVGKFSPDLDNLLTARGARSWAYVTAYNPASMRVAEQENRAQQARLEGEIRRLTYAAFPGEGVGDDEAWPPEPSLLIIDIARDEAVRLGQRFGQVAIVYGELRGPAQLVACL